MLISIAVINGYFQSCVQKTFFTAIVLSLQKGNKFLFSSLYFEVTDISSIFQLTCISILGHLISIVGRINIILLATLISVSMM